jgi:UDP-2,4-diacetamido-2,4,6-trideoxy-beta-L-altropyranose hydrolase
VSLKVTFRADASITIGTGHVMRCLTLAEALRARGHTCRFITRDLPGHLGTRIAAQGFDCTLLPAPLPDFVPEPGAPAHAAWAGLPWSDDAEATRTAAVGADVLVVDHYAFDARWEAAARPDGARLMVIDDLADRPHQADVLLDQNFGRRSADYDDLLPAGTERLVGPRYALLRPEFAGRRPAALAERAARGFALSQVLVSMGGIDLPNATGKVLDVLAARPALEVTVVMGPNAPALAEVRAQAAAMPRPAKVLVDVTDMASLMAKADLAIGAAGGSAWERCVFGLPTLLGVLADNQASAARALEAAGVVVGLGRPEAADFTERLMAALDRAGDQALLAAMSGAAAAVADGKGAERVAKAIEHPLVLRPATLADAEAIWHWRRALPPEHFRRGSIPSLPDHLAWFERALGDPQRCLFVAGDPAEAHLRLDFGGHGSATVSVILAPQIRGQGHAVRLLCGLADAAQALGLHRLIAEVQEENAASLSAFLAAGYALTDTTDGFRQLTRAL